MYRFLTVAIMLFAAHSCFAQKADSLFISNTTDGWYITHKVHPGETLFSVARRYHVPPAMLADANNMTYNGDLTGKSSMKIPLGAYNQATSPMSSSDARPVYYRTTAEDNLYHISKRAGTQQYRLQELNHMTDNSIRPGQVLLTGYILYDATEMPVVTNPKVPPVKNNTAANIPPRTTTITAPPPIPGTQTDTFKLAADTAVSKGEQLYLEQTNNGENATAEKGPAAFFPMSAGSGDIYFGFHNTAPKGTIVKVHNPGNGKEVYVKIIGSLPANKKFYNTVIGISNRARASLGTVEQRLWVELSYRAY